MSILFSNVVLTYNGERTIWKLFKRLTEEVDRYSKEFIIIDSGSTDKTLEILSYYQKKVINFKVIKIKKENFNHGETRNFGVKLSKGRFICFFSQDVLPRNSFFRYCLDDFRMEEKVVAVFGKHIPTEDMPLVQKIETSCLWEKLDQYTDKKGRILQNLSRPFIPFTQKNKLYWYLLSNAASCYKRDFLLNYPFHKTDYGEDLLMGKLIIEKGLSKVYDRRCIVLHSHPYNIRQYAQREEKELNLRLVKLGIRPSINILCKVEKIVTSEFSFYIKLYNLFKLFTYYLIKIFLFMRIFTSKAKIKSS